MMDGGLVLIHGFWSSLSTWDGIVQALRADADLSGLRVHPFGYESPKRPPLPFSTTRIPDLNDIAQSLGAYISAHAPSGNLVIVTHSQGGLILQRFLAWMLNDGQGRRLARIRTIVLLACPNEGSEYLRSIRSAAGFKRHPQARDLEVFSADVAAARRTVLNQVVHASNVNDRECPIRIHAYAGRTDRVVSRVPAQSSFPNAATLPGDHFSIIDPDASGSLTVATLKQHLLEALTAEHRPGMQTSIQESAPPRRPIPPKYHVEINNSTGIHIGDSGTQQ
jgi:pimeloyl-ACP methyl ester carboxylesterase